MKLKGDLRQLNSAVINAIAYIINATTCITNATRYIGIFATDIAIVTTYITNTTRYIGIAMSQAGGMSDR